MTDTMKQEIERLALASHRATERYRALSMQNTATEPDEREKQAVDYALATAEMFEARRVLDAAVSPNESSSPTPGQRLYENTQDAIPPFAPAHGWPQTWKRWTLQITR